MSELAVQCDKPKPLDRKQECGRPLTDAPFQQARVTLQVAEQVRVRCHLTQDVQQPDRGQCLLKRKGSTSFEAERNDQTAMSSSKRVKRDSECYRGHAPTARERGHRPNTAEE